MNFLHCIIHSESELNFICLTHDDYDDCPIKLCTTCLNEHFKNVGKKLEFKANETFREKVLDEMLSPKYDDKGFTKILDTFKRNISKIQIQFALIMQEVTNQFYILWEHACSLTTEFQNYKQSLLVRDIEYFSKFDISKLSNLLQPNSKFEKIQDHQNKCLAKLYIINDELGNQLSIFQEKIDKFTQNEIVLEEIQHQGQHWKLIGKEIFGVKHGRFFYKSNNNNIIEAGEFSFNQKNGKWQELQNQQQLDIYSIGEYISGFKCGRWQIIHKETVIGGGNYDKNGKKKGIWDEICDEQFLINIASGEKPLIITGLYENGMRQGTWRVIIENPNSKQIEQFKKHKNDSQIKY